MKINITIDVEVNELKELFGLLEESKADELPKNTKGNKLYEGSIYAKWFDDSSACYTKDPEFNLTFIKDKQKYANELLKSQRYIFLNDVYEMLGLPKTKAGCIVGWTYDEERPYGDNYVDFGLTDDNDVTRDFVTGYRSTVLLDFNVDGNIINLI